MKGVSNRMSARCHSRRAWRTTGNRRPIHCQPTPYPANRHPIHPTDTLSTQAGTPRRARSRLPPRETDSSCCAPRPYTLHPTPYTLHPTPYTLQPAPNTYTPHPTPYTLPPTPYTRLTPYTHVRRRGRRGRGCAWTGVTVLKWIKPVLKWTKPVIKWTKPVLKWTKP